MGSSLFRVDLLMGHEPLAERTAVCPKPQRAGRSELRAIFRNLFPQPTRCGLGQSAVRFLGRCRFELELLTADELKEGRSVPLS